MLDISEQTCFCTRFAELTLKPNSKWCAFKQCSPASQGKAPASKGFKVSAKISVLVSIKGCPNHPWRDARFGSQKGRRKILICIDTVQFGHGIFCDQKSVGLRRSMNRCAGQVRAAVRHSVRSPSGSGHGFFDPIQCLHVSVWRGCTDAS